MAKFTVHVEGSPKGDPCVALALHVKGFVSKLTSERIDLMPIAPGTDRHAMREAILERLTFVFYSLPREVRPLPDVRAETFVRYGPAVDQFIDRHLDLVAEIRLLAMGGPNDEQ